MRICYFGLFNPEFGRNKIYIEALRKVGHTVILCQDNSKGFLKYLKLWKSHSKIKKGYDFMIVGYPGHIVVPLAKMISKKSVVADALGSLYDAEIHSHDPSFFRKIKSWLADWLLVKFSDKILLESFAQKQYFESKFGKSYKYAVVYTGADDKFVKGVKTKGKDEFCVLFRGKLTPESGIMHILEAAKALKNNKDIRIKIIGSGYLLNDAAVFIKREKLYNVMLLSKFLSDDELVATMQDADLLLGQFEDNPRLNRTIPHKAFEAMALGIPYISGDAPAIREIAQDGINAFLVPLADSSALAAKILFLSQNSEILCKVRENTSKIFDERFSSHHLVDSILKVL